LQAERHKAEDANCPAAMLRAGHLHSGTTGSPEAVARPRFPQNVACGFPAPTLFGSWFTALPAPAAPDRGDAVLGSATASVL
jgi:hypothetical protein